MNTPTEAGFYWARIYPTSDFEPVWVIAVSCKFRFYEFTEKTHSSILDVHEWGEKIERREPQEVSL